MESDSNSSESTAADVPSAVEEDLCTMGPWPKREFPTGFDPFREFAIVENLYKWINGTVLHYYLLPSKDATDKQKAVVRWAFGEWTALGSGLHFREVDDPLEAELRIAFNFAGQRSSSLIGTYNLKIKHPNPTMTFGWDLTTEWGHATALHEIGHAVGLKHEHQNPNAGIVWDEAAVIKHYKQTNDWDEQTVRHNILNKLEPGDITGTDWDVTSLMHYPIAAGLIIKPEGYGNKSTPRNVTFSAQDKAFVLSTYPKSSQARTELKPMSLVPLALESGEQADLILAPDGTRDYQIQTVGKSDSRIVAFELWDGEPRFVAADDDSAEERNAGLLLRLVQGREYLLKVRLHSAYGGQGFGVMMF